MTNLEKKCFEKLDLYKSATRNPKEWFNRNPKYAVIMILCLIANFPFFIIAHILQIICMPFHWAYEKLDDWIY